jgi:hypothetical protein
LLLSLEGGRREKEGNLGALVHATTKPYYKKSHRAWYPDIGPGKRPVRLASEEEGEEKAYEKYYAKMAGRQPVDHTTLVADLLDILTVLKQTGCRPTEARQVQTRHFDRPDKCWIFEEEARSFATAKADRGRATDSQADCTSSSRDGGFPCARMQSATRSQPMPFAGALTSRPSPRSPGLLTSTCCLESASISGSDETTMCGLD